ncbi:hypothetical protein ACWEP8_32820 [Streptomyces hydrogenans]
MRQADAQAGEVGVEAAVEGGVGGSAAVVGQELGGLRVVGTIDQVLGYGGVGVQDAPDVALGEPVGLECAPRPARARLEGGGGDPGGDLVARRSRAWSARAGSVDHVRSACSRSSRVTSAVRASSGC